MLIPKNLVSIEYDKDFRNIHLTTSQGFEIWKEYDEYGNEIHYLDSTGRELRRAYDIQGRRTYFMDENKAEHWYDDRGNLTHYKNAERYEMWFNYEYLHNETVINYRNSTGYEYSRTVPSEITNFDMSEI